MMYLDTKFFILINFLFSIIFFYFSEIIYSSFINQLIIFLIPLIWPGLAHGSLDILTAKRKKLINHFPGLVLFLILYIAIPILFLILWKLYPNYGFTMFLILSLMHFGISDKLSKKEIMIKVEILLRSLIIICLPIVFYNEQTLNILYFLNITKEYGFFLTELLKILFYLIIPLTMFLFIFSLKKREYALIIDLAVLFFCFVFFKPLVSFLIYFCFLHSVRHLLNEKKILGLSNKKLFLKTIPMTGIVLLILTFIFSIYLYYPTSINLFSLNDVVVAMFCLTLSHVFLINFVKDKI